MGLYLNPPGMSKEDWLRQHGIRATAKQMVDEYQTQKEKGFVPIVLVDNGHFTAAGIGSNLDETRVFCDPKDPRHKLYFWAHLDHLRKIQDEGFQTQMKSYGL